MPLLHHWSDVDVVTVGPTVTKQVVAGTGGSLARIALGAGSKAGRHTHAFEQFVHVESGSGWLETEEGVRRFSAGSLFHFPAETWHSAEFDEDTILVEVNMLTASR